MSTLSITPPFGGRFSRRLRGLTSPVSTSFRSALLALGPSFYWPLDATNGVTDQSGNGRNGTGQAGITIGGFTGSPLTTGDGKSTDFDGVDDYISSTYNPFVNGTTRTFLGWGNRDTNSSFDVLFGTTLSAASSPRMYLASGNQDVVFQPNTSGAAVSWVGAWPGNTQWVFWVLVFNESTDQASFYINGSLVSTQTQSVAWTTTNAITFGTYATTSDPFDGKMGHLAVVESGLTGAQISNLYAVR